MKRQEKLIIRPKELAKNLSISPTTLWRWQKGNILPRPINLGPRMIGWLRKDIDEWLNELNNQGGI